MNCTNCGTQLTATTAFCPNCGTPAPDQGAASSYNPTEASPYGSGQNYPPLPPTIAANPEGYAPQGQNPDTYPPQPQTPYTNYGGATPQQAPYDPYNTPLYENGMPPQPPPFNPESPGPYYGTPPIPGYAPNMQPGMYATPPKKRSRVGLIIGISVLALVLLCGGTLFAAAQLGKKAATPAVATATDAPAATSATDNAPGNGDIVPAAARILFGVQTSSAVDANVNPTHVTTTFAAGKEVDLTFKVDSAGKTGYIKARWYEDGQEIDSAILAHDPKNDHGYFGETYASAGNGSAALYWCTKSDCSDEQLAQIANFTITGTGAVPTTNNSFAMRDWRIIG